MNVTRTGVLRLVLRPAVRRALVGRARSRARARAGRFRRADADGLLESALASLPELLTDRKREPTVGARHGVVMAALTIAFFRALVDAGIERAYAIELTGDVTWRVLAPAARLGAAASAGRGRSPTEHIRRRVDLITRFPFGRPAFEFTVRAEPRGRALDMFRCPIADYMAAHGLADLCVGTWCNADFALAEAWGARLERKGTLAGGASQCDFRFVVGDMAGGSATPPSGAACGALSTACVPRGRLSGAVGPAARAARSGRRRGRRRLAKIRAGAERRAAAAGAQRSGDRWSARDHGDPPDPA